MPEAAPLTTAPPPPRYTDAELLAEVTRALEEDRAPFSDRPAPAPPRATAAPAPPVSAPADDVFSVDDLFAAENPLNVGTPYTMPNGKRVWVFGLNTADLQLLTDWATRIVTEDPERLVYGDHETKPRRAMKVFAAQMDLLVNQVIVSCRNGPDRERSNRVFGRKHFVHLRDRLGYEIIRHISSISDERSGGGEIVGNAAALFFSAASAGSGSLLSLCDSFTDCLSGWREARTPSSSSRLVDGSPDNEEYGTSAASDLRRQEADLAARLEELRPRAETLNRLMIQAAAAGRIDSEAAHTLAGLM